MWTAPKVNCNGGAITIQITHPKTYQKKNKITCVVSWLQLTELQCVYWLLVVNPNGKNIETSHKYQIGKFDMFSLPQLVG